MVKSYIYTLKEIIDKRANKSDKTHNDTEHSIQKIRLTN